MKINTIEKFNVIVEFEYVTDVTPIAAAIQSIAPLKLPDGSYDELALAEYEDFVINLLGVFDRQDFEVIEERESPYSKSFYFDLVKKDQFESKNYSYILYIRVSDHRLSLEKAAKQKDWYAEHADEQKQPESKSKQVWRLKQIIVNSTTYSSYEEALQDVEKRLASM